MNSNQIQIRNTVLEPTLNKGTAFQLQERKKYNIKGLLPAKVETIETQRLRLMSRLRNFKSHLEKYTFLNMLKQRNETLFYNMLLHHADEILPIVDTRQAGEACVKLGPTGKIGEGMYFSLEDMTDIRKMLDNWPSNNAVEIIAVTDGSQILGVGDMGINGIAVPINKLSMYVTLGGFHPSKTIPVMIDLGTNNKELLEDPLYLGKQHKRVNDEYFYSIMDEFISAVKDKWPAALVQFQDFTSDHCFELLRRY
jgi:malate dehydrogenase (oxaloacetate-decarboxylating)(NADP+)